MLVYINAEGKSPSYIYWLCLILGTCAGYWAVLVTVAAEQFGTDIRSTVATSVPNFVRGSGMIIASSFLFLKPHYSITQTTMIIGGVVFFLGFVALIILNETYGMDLEFVESEEN
jgi:ABC-type spermidine/putrescine transport system permease subunit II